ncbi:MAG TPA: VOC family protein [Candidatus Dojkabacteria bacterium]|jgi:predicted lactoylglutathione lyase
MSFNQISNINLFSEKNQRLIEFYKSLGMKPRDNNKSDWFGFHTQGVTFAIEPISNREEVSKILGLERNDSILIQFKAKDFEELDSMTKHLKSLGITVIRDKQKVSYGTVTNFLDPDGNLVEILLEKE